MEKWDQGLGSIGLISLAVILTLLVFIGAPIAASKTNLDLKDWLGFSGSVLGAAMTLGAAIVAWKAVQRQIGVQREATIIGLMTREEGRLEDELQALSACSELMAEATRLREFSPRGYVEHLNRIGYRASDVEMRRAIREAAGDNIPPRWLEQIARASSDLVSTVIVVETFTTYETSPGTPSLFLQVHVPAPEKFRNDLRLKEEEFDKTFALINARRKVIATRLLPKLRGSIEDRLLGTADH
ncbi:hypothetical protein [Bradyrhizobium sp. SZCCHNRI1058]|uniref:hypothetical protein n=1 Tax=Bradyrhizobium sp. SZCCHNRI1058 TaxID=3057279 RepID=UPI002916FF2E|nr:hypothetical protein [Bradyrhizobium sp. SZCCHNRI1058]